MVWQQNQIQVSCLWLHPVAVIWSARIHNQSEPRGVSEKCQSLLHAAGSPLPVQVQCLLSPGQIPYSSNCNNGREQTTTTEQKHAPPLATSQRRNKKTDKEKQCWNKELDRAREKTRTNIWASFQRWRCCQDFSAGQVRTCWICLTLCFNHKAKMVVTVILSIAHITVRCCSGATQLVAKSSLLAFMLTLAFSFVFMATG